MGLVSDGALPPLRSAFGAEAQDRNRPVADVGLIALASGMLSYYSITTRIFQLLGAVVFAGTAFLAVAFLFDGDRLASLFSAAVALACVAFIILAGWMRRRVKAWSDKFPPSVR